jgi:hypothetical protein
MKNILKITSAGLLLLIAASCSKNSTDTGISLSFKGVTTVSSTAKSISAATPFSFTEALIGIKEIEIKRKEEHLHDTLTARDTLKHKFDFKGKYLVDLLTGTTTPDFGLVNFVPGTYNKSETARLIDGGKSISVKGTYTDAGSKAFNFNFSTRGEFEFEFESDSGFVLTEGSVLEMLININLPLMFTNVDFAKGTADVNNVYLINESSNIELFKKIKHNIRDIAEMHEDKHHEH